jgi:putative MATE family efflux protein
LFAIGLTILGFAFAPFLFGVLGATGDYLELALDYMNVILAGTVFFVLQSVLNASLNSQGDTKSYRNVLIAGFALNCALDPWFMFGGLGIPALGIRGVAVATVVIQILGTAYLLRKLSATKLWDGPIWSNFFPSSSYKEIARQGIPASLNMVTVAVGIFVITFFISRFSTEGVAAYGIATRIEQIVLLPTIGLNIAVLSLAGQNNGAKKFDRVRETWNTTMRYGLTMMAVGGFFIFFLPCPLMSFFTDDEVVIGHGVDYLRIASVTLCSYVILFQTVSLLQGLKRPFYAIIIGVYRQVLAPGIVFYLLAFYYGFQESGIWWGIFLVTWSAAIITFFYGRHTLNRITSA